MPDLREQLERTLHATYSIGRELGGGGMARVFLAEETALGRTVVVKVLSPDLAAGINVDRFKREIQLAARLQHPHIVPLLSAGETDGLPYYTMPFVEGESLRARLARDGALPVPEVVGILCDVAQALAYAHARGVVHRDIKPDNVLLTGGVAVVTDFGIAKALSASRAAVPGATLTQFGTSLGTPAYMAPEQAAADPRADHRADLYAFGVMAYEMLAGGPPFHGRAPQQLLAAQLSEPAPPIQRMRPDTPPQLAELVMRCLEKEADRRPESAAALVTVLDAVTSGVEHRAAPAILLGGRGMLRKALLLYGAAFVAIAILARAAIVAVGLPDWVFPGAMMVMAFGLPVILFTGLVHREARRALTTTPTRTPGGSTRPPSTMATLAVKASPWVSWRRTAMGGIYALAAFAMLVGAYMLLRSLGVGPVGSLVASGRLARQEPILVSDFRVHGADSTLGSVLSEGVRTDLGQSSVVTVVPPSTVAAALERMQRPATSRLDLALARELAQREGIKAVVDGEVTPLANGYIITLRLVTADSGNELTSFHETVDGPKELIPALDRLTRNLRGKIGESLRAVRADPPLEQVTTSSLAALRKYAEGTRANDFGDPEKAVPLLEEAVALDTGFAMAYRKLGVALGNSELNPQRADSAYAKAYRYRDRLPERERELAIAAYFDFGPGHDRARAAAAYETVLARDSVDRIALNNMANLWSSRREFVRAESLLARAITARTASSLEHGGLVEALFNQGKFDSAAAKAADYKRRFPDAPYTEWLDEGFLFQRGQLDSMAMMEERVRHSRYAANRAWATYRLAQLAMLRGRLAESARLQIAARAADAARGAFLPPLDDSITSAYVDAWFRGQPTRAVEKLDALLAHVRLDTLPPLQRRYDRIATVYALAGRPDRARAVLARAAAEVKDSALIRFSQPALHNALGEVALAEHRPRDAIAEFAHGDSLADGPASPCMSCLPIELARAYDQAGNRDSALVMLERYLAAPGVFRLPFTNDAFYYAGAFKRLGELYDARGDRAKAAANYARFVDLWKDADPELQPGVAAVRRRLAVLRGSEGR